MENTKKVFAGKNSQKKLYLCSNIKIHDMSENSNIIIIIPEGKVKLENFKPTRKIEFLRV